MRVEDNFFATDLDRSDLAEDGCKRGVPMGGDLKAAPAGKAPSFLIRTMSDPDGANLDCVQVVKGWLDAAGKTHEKVYDVAWSGGRKRDLKTGKLPAVGNTVNVKEATYTNGIGSPALQRAGRTRRSTRSRGLPLRARAGDPDPTADDVRRQGLRRGAAHGRAGQHPGARVQTPIWYTP